MTSFRGPGKKHGGILWYAAFGAIAIVSVRGQNSAEPSPGDLVRLLLGESENGPSARAAAVGPDCSGSAARQQRRELALALVRMGDSAVPSMRSALTAFERDAAPGKMYRSEFLLYAFAKNQGEAAAPRLRSMIRQSKYHPIQYILDNAMALSLGITSYVDDTRRPSGMFLCRAQEPRDALDDLVIAWQAGDRALLDKSLGPAAKSTLEALPGGGGWAEFRRSLWPGKAAGGSVGYRFDVPGPLAEPAESLDAEIERQRIVPGRSSNGAVIDIKTYFSNGSGAACGSLKVTFLGINDPSFPGRARYVIDNSNLGDLLRLVGSCATKAR